MEEVSWKNTQDLSFNAALEGLEEKVRKLEVGQLPLEEALECFKEGITLVRICSSKLKDAETTIQKLIQDEEGNIIEASFKAPLDGELD